MSRRPLIYNGFYTVLLLNHMTHIKNDFSMVFTDLD